MEQLTQQQKLYRKIGRRTGWAFFALTQTVNTPAHTNRQQSKRAILYFISFTFLPF